MDRRPCKLLIAATGSVAAMKIPILIQTLFDLPPEGRNYFFEVHVVLTENAKHFFQTSELPKEVKVYDEKMEWDLWQQRGDPVLHCELGRWADLMVIAPLDANTLGKIANGLCDNLLTCLIRAWDRNKALLFCPAMNVKMWEHPVTPGQIETLKSWGYIEIPPISKTLMCGDVGVGAMSEVQDIVVAILKVTDAKFSGKETNSRV